MAMFYGKAAPEQTELFLKSHGVHADQIRSFCGVSVSSLGVGTYLGQMDEATDMKVALAGVLATELGANFFDTAINYRGQRGERSVGEAIRRLVLSSKAKREELFVSSKAGFVPYEGRPVQDLRALFEEQYVKSGIAKASDLIAGCHCMEPAFLRNQIERSQKNLGLRTIDLYYLHNPETQLEEIPPRVFYEKLERAFEAMEQSVREGSIGAYGMATWNAFREQEGVASAVSLERAVRAAENAARAAGNARHSFRAIQLPLNLAMPEAGFLATQALGSAKYTALDAAHELGLSVAVSVPLFQGRLCHGLPDALLERFPRTLSQAHAALAFATSLPGVGAAMVGMKHPDHVRHNLEWLKQPRLAGDMLLSIARLF